MRKNVILSVAAVLLFVLGLTVMIRVTPSVTQKPPETTEAVTEPVTTRQETTTEQGTTEPETSEFSTEPPTEPADTTPPAQLDLTASKAFVYDCTENSLLYVGGDPEEKAAPASLTKLMTALVALKYLDEDTVITVGEEVTWIDPDSSIAAVQSGNRLTVKMLVQGLLMQSGNDAAYALAVAGGREIVGNPELDRRQALGVFVDAMNSQCRDMGLVNTHFMNPDGIDEDGHYSCVSDLITISLSAMENDTVMKYCGMASDYVVFESGEDYVWKSSNYLLHEDLSFYTPEAIGLKTGSTELAGKCLISAFRQEDGRTLLIGVLGSTGDGQRYTDTLTLYNMYK